MAPWNGTRRTHAWELGQGLRLWESDTSVLRTWHAPLHPAHPLRNGCPGWKAERLRKGGGHCQGTQHPGPNSECLSLRKLLPAPSYPLGGEGLRDGAEGRGLPSPPPGDRFSEEARGARHPAPLLPQRKDSPSKQPWLPSCPAPSGLHADRRAELLLWFPETVWAKRWAAWVESVLCPLDPPRYKGFLERSPDSQLERAPLAKFLK